MSVQTLYEVLTLKSGEWVVDSTYGDRDGAIEVAKSLHAEKRFDAVKVVRDTYDASTGTAKEVVVFDTTSKISKERSQQAAAAAKTAAAQPASTSGPAPVPARGKPAGKRKGSDVGLAVKAVVWLAIILGGGLGAIFALNYAGFHLAKLF